MLLKIFMALFLIILIPMYWKTYGVQNFLWLSDIGLFLTCLGVWFESRLLISMALIGVLPFEIVWFFDYGIQLITHQSFLGISDYMFDEKYTKFLRSLSFFHIMLPILWVWLILKWGYDKRAFVYQTFLTWIIIIATYIFTDWDKNINWVFMPKVYHWHWMPPYVWLIILLIGIPLFLLLPLHLFLSYIMSVDDWFARFKKR